MRLSCLLIGVNSLLDSLRSSWPTKHINNSIAIAKDERTIHVSTARQSLLSNGQREGDKEAPATGTAGCNPWSGATTPSSGGRWRCSSRRAGSSPARCSRPRRYRPDCRGRFRFFLHNPPPPHSSTFSHIVINPLLSLVYHSSNWGLPVDMSQ